MDLFAVFGPEAWIALAAVAASVLAVVVTSRRRLGPRSDPSEVTPEASDGDLGDRLAATRSGLWGALASLLRGRKIDLSLLEPLEEALLRADVGVATTDRLLGTARKALSAGETDGDRLADVLRGEIAGMLSKVERAFNFEPTAKPHVVLVVGVNGSGKTTTVGKLAARYRAAGRTVAVAAADTFRAAAVDQLAVWAERSGALLFRRDEGADPASVVHDAVAAVTRDGIDVLLVDTAGRLQNRRPLMEELSKVRRVLQRALPDAPHETWIVLDGTMGNNALTQARAFHEATPLTGAVVTKLDGTARGGMILAVASDLALPVPLIGVGERVEDLRPFDAKAFGEAILADV